MTAADKIITSCQLMEIIDFHLTLKEITEKMTNKVFITWSSLDGWIGWLVEWLISLWIDWLIDWLFAQVIDCWIECFSERCQYVIVHTDNVLSYNPTGSCIMGCLFSLSVFAFLSPVWCRRVTRKFWAGSFRRSESPRKWDSSSQGAIPVIKSNEVRLYQRCLYVQL